MAFDVDGFVADCVAAVREVDPVAAVAELVQRAVSDPAPIQRMAGPPLDPDDDGVLHVSPEVLVALGVFPPGFATGIHDHGTAAVIGTWAAHEDNLLYRRTPAGRLEQNGQTRVQVGEVLVLDAAAVHDVHAPRQAWCGGLHVYLGDLTTAPRSFWPDAASTATPFSGQRQERAWLEAARATELLR